MSFVEAVHACAGKVTVELDVFRRYLLQKDDPGAISRLEKNLLFYLEVQKFKVILDSSVFSMFRNNEQIGKTLIDLLISP